MTVRCPICRTRISVDDTEVARGVEVQCDLCDEIFVADVSMEDPETSKARASAVQSRRLSDDPDPTADVPRILVAHDSHHFCEHARELLEDEGYDVSVVYEGIAAHELLTTHPPAVAVLDSVLPGHRGGSLTTVLKQADSPVRVVLVASVYERARIHRETVSELAPDGFVDPRNVDRELLPCVRKLTGIAAGVLAPRKRSTAVGVSMEPAFEDSRPSDSLDLESKLQGLLETESNTPADFDDDEDREIWDRIRAEEGVGEDSEPSFDLNAEVSLASAKAAPDPRDEPVDLDDNVFDPASLMLDDGDDGDDDDDEFVERETPAQILESLPSLAPAEADSNLTIPGESSLQIALDPEPEPQPEPRAAGDDADADESFDPAVLQLDDLDDDDDDESFPGDFEDPPSAPIETPATIPESPAFVESSDLSVSSALEIPMIEDDVEDEDLLIENFDSALGLGEPNTDELPEADRPTAEPRSSSEFYDTSGLPPRLREEHSNAQRLARIIVSDIVLYNQDRVTDAIRGDTFFDDLRGDIKDGRTFFEEKVSAEVREQCDYLQKMLENLVDEKRKELGL